MVAGQGQTRTRNKQRIGVLTLSQQNLILEPHASFNGQRSSNHTHTRAEGPNPMLESVGEEITQQYLHAHQRGATYSVRIDQG